MDVQIAQHGAVTVLAVSGSIDALTASTLSHALSGELAQGRSRLVADFAQVDYTSSAGLRAILIALKEARRQGGDLRLAAVTPRVRKVLDIGGFTNLVQSFPDAAQAVASFAA